MIQYYLDLQKQVKIIHQRSLEYGQIQKIYSTAFFISLSIRSPGKTWHLYLGRGGGHEGVWPGDDAPVAELRRKDNFLEYLRKHLSSCSFVSLALDDFDRIIRLDYQKFGQLQSMLFFWKARKLYFAHYFQEAPLKPFKLMLSWEGRAHQGPDKEINLFSCFDIIGRKLDMKHDRVSPTMPSIKCLLEQELKLSNLRSLKKTPDFLHRKMNHIEMDLAKAKEWELIQKVLDRSMPLDMFELRVGRHKIKLNKELNEYEKRNLLFEKIKKLKRGEKILSQRLAEVREQLSGKVKEVQLAGQLPLIKPQWGKETQVAKTTLANPESKDTYKVFKFNDYSIGVGLNSQGNDQLRNHWANKEDLWIHLEGQKSAHAVIKMGQLATLSPEVLDIAASIVAYFSRFQGEWIPVIFTQVKNLKGVTGSAGMVTYKKEKHLQCRFVDPVKWLGDQI